MTTTTCLILGSSGGIGHVLCERLAKRGASLVLGGRDPEKSGELAAKTGGAVYPGDARDATAAEQAVTHAVERFGRLDGAVNLVGSILLKSAHLTKPGERNEVIATTVAARRPPRAWDAPYTIAGRAARPLGRHAGVGRAHRRSSPGRCDGRPKPRPISFPASPLEVAEALGAKETR